MVFSNADKDKLAIFNYIKGKAGIYNPRRGSLTNKLNAKKYVGSSGQPYYYVEKFLSIRCWFITKIIVHNKDRILWLREHRPVSYPFLNLKRSYNYNIIHCRNYSQVTNGQPK